MNATCRRQTRSEDRVEGRTRGSPEGAETQADRGAMPAFAVALIAVGARELLGWFSAMGKVPIFDGR